VVDWPYRKIGEGKGIQYLGGNLEESGNLE
jgi:hypothetical protein